MKTMKFQGKDYASVKDRLLQFRKENPKGLIETVPTVTDTHIIFKARIVKDNSQEGSPEATGHSMAEIKGDKVKMFEKQETIAVGRALANLGYAADGEIASSEEMEEFIAYKDTKVTLELEALNTAKNLSELKEVWIKLSPEAKKRGEQLKKELKEKLTTA